MGLVKLQIWYCKRLVHPARLTGTQAESTLLRLRWRPDALGVHVLPCGCLGLIFGYDIGISGGVSEMEPFLKRFFSHILERMAAAKGNEYFVYDRRTARR
ncbi:hypothetical protein PR202_ga20131 [Eleusine coracana subsp. coracana]|uniref:Uncharacterized protein n=1 Tax=Eleusine coracana subsp. coracana TaxID=191504 RepID=A0AAV5CWZ1_ELECO|nr:hypothetical protein PR202_ga20131 [Eleusine coracana subsp. coracana]